MNTAKLSTVLVFALITATLSFSTPLTSVSSANNSHNPTWWDKYQFILNSGADGHGPAD